MGKLSTIAEGDDVEWRPPEDIQAEIRDTIITEQRKYKTRYDAERYKGVQYEVGDVVMLKAQTVSTGQSTKTQPKYKGSLVIVEVLPCDVYRVASVAGTEGRYFTTTANVSRLKIYRNCEESESESDSEIETTSDEDSTLNERGEIEQKLVESEEIKETEQEGAESEQTETLTQL